MKNALALVAIALLWGFVITVIDPRGDFPQNDDWMFAEGVRALLANGRVELSEQATVYPLVQVVLGAAASALWGDSYTTLRAVTLMLALGTLGFLWQTLCVLGVSFPVRVCAVLACSLNPLFVSLSFTFMTDIPFLFFLSASVYYAVGALRHGSWRWYLGATGAACLAVGVRPPGLLLPLAFLMTMALTWKRQKPPWLKVGLLAGLPCLLVWGMPALAARIGLLPANYNLQTHMLLRELSETPFRDLFLRAFGYGVAMDMTLGLLLFPLSLLASGILREKKDPEEGRRMWLGFWTAAVLLGLSLGIFALMGWPTRMPLAGNTIFDFGLGPVFLKDVTIWGMDHWGRAPAMFWIAMTAASVLGVALLAGLGVSSGGTTAQGDATSEGLRVKILLAVFVLVYALPQLVVGFYDRYLLPIVYVALIWISIRVSEETAHRVAWRHTIPVLAVIIGGGVFALGGTRDHLAFQRARHAAGDYLLDTLGVPASRIDGGFEWNGPRTSSHPRKALANGKSWWWVEDDAFLITLGPVPGYREVHTLPFDRILPPGRRTVYVLSRVDEATAEVPGDKASLSSGASSIN